MWLTWEHAVNRYGDGYLPWINSSIRVSLGVPPQEGVLHVSDPLHLFEIILLMWAYELDMHPADEFGNLICVDDGSPEYRKS